ncbi:MAG: C40 family peptidase [Rhodoferax sp.]|nr:C40 family peptidase [Rhodoferax sp.]MDP3651777.1 C40 family peptidase [Rhodoferax sp.]
MNVDKRGGLASVLMVLLFALAGCGTVPPQYAPSANAGDVPSRLSQAQSNEVTVYAIGLVGTPYRYGGNTPESGFDCSGLIGHVFRARGGVASPRTVAKLQTWGQSVPRDSVRTADLVLFIQSGTAVHAGIYVGDGRFVHAPSTGGEVRLDDLRSKYWSSQQVAFRRP